MRGVPSRTADEITTSPKDFALTSRVRQHPAVLPEQSWLCEAFEPTNGSEEMVAVHIQDALKPYCDGYIYDGRDQCVAVLCTEDVDQVWSKVVNGRSGLFQRSSVVIHAEKQADFIVQSQPTAAARRKPTGFR